VAGSNGEESDNASSLGEVEVADLTGKRPVKKTHRREIPPISLPPSGPSIPVIRYRAFDPNNAYPSQVTSSSNSGHQQFCGLCEMRHGEGDCSMTKSSKNLAEFRQMLISHSDDEPVEVRVWPTKFAKIRY
jgi:hypothetical protein